MKKFVVILIACLSMLVTVSNAQAPMRIPQLPTPGIEHFEKMPSVRISNDSIFVRFEIGKSCLDKKDEKTIMKYLEDNNSVCMVIVNAQFNGSDESKRLTKDRMVYLQTMLEENSYGNISENRKTRKMWRAVPRRRMFRN